MRILWSIALGFIGAGAWAQEIVPEHVLLSQLAELKPIVEFNHDVHVRPTARTFFFQNGKAVPFQRLNTKDSYCYLGTYVDLYEPKTFHKGEAYSGMHLVSEKAKRVELVNGRHEAIFSRAAREDLFVLGCESRPETVAPLKAGDLYRHLGYNVLLKSTQVARDIKLIGQASASLPITKPTPSFAPSIRKAVFNRSSNFVSRSDNGYDRSRYIFQNGQLISDHVNLTGLDKSKFHCTLRFHEDLRSTVTYASGAEFVPVREYRMKHGFILESDQYVVNRSVIRSLRCERQDGGAIHPADVTSAFGELISLYR